METELRTYNLRDGSGLLAFSTDDPAEAEAHLAENPGHRPDDFTKTEIRERAKQKRAAARDTESALKEAEQADSERERQVKARAKELAGDPKALALAVARLEQR